MTPSIVRRTTLASAIVGCMVLAGTVVAQTNPAAPSGSNGSMYQSGSETKMPAIPSKSESADSAFEKLDTAHNGYVTRAEADKLNGFDMAFRKGDANHDGKLSQSEFRVAWDAYTGRGS